MSEVLVAIAAETAVRIIAVDAIALSDETARRHGLARASARLASDGVVATALMSAHIKGDERILLQLQGSRPQLGFLGQIDGHGHLRARFRPSTVPAWGGDGIDGVLLAIKSDGDRELYRGAVEIADGSVADALQTHLRDSAQVDAVLRIEGGRGMLVERMPHDPDLPSLDRETFFERFGWLAEADFATVLADIDNGRLHDEEVDVLGRRALSWTCQCSQERVEAMIAALGPDEIDDMIGVAAGGAEVTCHFCNEVRTVSVERLELLKLQTN